MYDNPFLAVKKGFAAELRSAAKSAFGIELGIEEVMKQIVVPVEGRGDMSSSIAFRVAFAAKTTPHLAAVKILEKVGKAELAEKIEELDGYINLWLNRRAYSKAVIGAILSNGDDYGRNETGNGKKVAVEFPSVNPNKPWHVGHLRNALLGDAVANILSACSYDVERLDYIDDLGLQIAESLWSYIHLSDKPNKKFDQWLGEEYVKVNETMKEKNIDEEIAMLGKKLEEQGSEESRTSRKLSEECVKAQYETAFAYGIYHNVLVWESDIVRARLMEKALEKVKETGVASEVKGGKYNGCLAVDLSRIKDPKIAKEFSGMEEEMKVLVRSNGVATYLAKDLGFHMWKFGLIESGFRFAPFISQPNGETAYSTSEHGEEGKKRSFGNVEMSVNVIASQQRYPQLLLRALFDIMGYGDVARNIVHLSYGMISLEGGSIHGRSGGWMGDGRNFTADDLMEEMETKARAVVEQTEKKPKDIRKVVHAVAATAIKFEFLKISPEKEIVFSWQKALDFSANSGPYCMYTYARATRVLEKGGIRVPKPVDMDFEGITDGNDFRLVKMLGSMPDIVEKAGREYRPNLITDYLLDMSAQFSKFYETMPILNGGKDTNLRIAITYAARQVVGNMLKLIGITPVEQM